MTFGCDESAIDSLLGNLPYWKVFDFRFSGEIFYEKIRGGIGPTAVIFRKELFGTIHIWTQNIYTQI